MQKLIRYQPMIQSIRHQNGVVLFITLIVLVAMSLAGVALIRSVDSGTLSVGALASRQSAAATTELPINKAMFLFSKAAQTWPTVLPTGFFYVASNTFTSNAAYAYQSVYDPANSTQPGNSSGYPPGIPNVLLSTSTFDTAYPGIAQTTPQADETQRFLIERLCDTTRAGLAATTSNCIVDKAIAKAGPDDPNRPGGIVLPLYRVTVRIDGTRNTVSYAQVVFHP